MKQIIECVPNFSEGRDRKIIDSITGEMISVSGVSLLDVYMGESTNRSVITMAGPPEAVAEAAFRSIRRAGELIDMTVHKGEHPRFGAVDVCPLVPVSGISMDEAVELARKLAGRVAEELEFPVYCYGEAAFTKKRRELEYCRSGEYEGLRERITAPQWKPDFGPARFIPSFGAVAVGARGFLIAYNINLNTTSVRRANAVAFDVREQGRVRRQGGALAGKVLVGKNGRPLMKKGSLKSVKAIGWYVEEYGIAQVSMNLTDIDRTPIHQAFDEVCKKASARGIRVTGSELVGLVPLQAMLETGRYFLRKQQRSLGVSDRELITTAVKSLGLDELASFHPYERIIEYVLRKKDEESAVLSNMRLQEFVEETASESPAPGGGSISACMGSFGAALAAMVANLSSHKRGWDARWKEFSDWAERAKDIYSALLPLIDKDTEAFKKVMSALKLPKDSKAEAHMRKKALQSSLCNAVEVPFEVMKLALESMDTIKAMAENGLPQSASDAGVAALAARAAVRGAYLNVTINLGDIEDKKYVRDKLRLGKRMETKAAAMETSILGIVSRRTVSL